MVESSSRYVGPRLWAWGNLKENFRSQNDLLLLQLWHCEPNTVGLAVDPKRVALLLMPPSMVHRPWGSKGLPSPTGLRGDITVKLVDPNMVERQAAGPSTSDIRLVCSVHLPTSNFRLLTSND